MKVVVIIPTYNERDNIGDLLAKLHATRQSVKNHTIALLVVDDNSPDQTAEVVRKFAQTHPHVYITSGKKEGLGRALLRGMRYAVEKLGAEIIAQMDADLSHDPTVIPQFLKAIDGGADFVVGSRYIPGGSIPDNWAIYRKIYSVVGNAFVRFGLGFPRLHDWTGGYRAFKKIYFEKAKDELAPYSGYVFQIAFLYTSVLRGAKIVEIPIHFSDRRFGHSKIAPSEYIRNVILYVVSSRFQRLVTGTFGKFLVVGSIGFIINTIILELLVLLGLHPAVGSAVGAECAIISNFLLNNSWTFRHRKIAGGHMTAKFIQFNTTSLGALAIQAGSVALGTWLWGVSTYRLFYVAGVALGLIWNYTMYAKVIWKR